MAGSRVALVTDHAAQWESVAGHLGQVLGKPLFVTDYSLIRDVLGLDTDGLLLAGVSRPEDVEAATSLVQDVRLQKLAPRVVLVEGPSKLGGKQPANGPRQLTGRTMTDHIVVFDGNPRLIGQTVTARIEEASSFTLYGRVETSELCGPAHHEERASDGILQLIDNPSHLPAKHRIGLPLV